MATQPNTLLLLPPPPSPATYAAIKAAYHAPLITLLRSLNDNLARDRATPAERPILSIAITCPHLWTGRDEPRSTLFAHTQDIVKNVYKLVVIISAANGYNVEGVEGIDTRILLVAWPKRGVYDQDVKSLAGSWGPVLYLRDVAQASHLWTDIYGVESEEGEQVIRDFRTYPRSKGSPTTINIHKLRAGTTLVNASAKSSTIESANTTQAATRHLSVANGGTYDHLHIGHKLLLTMTAFALDKATPTSTPSTRASHTSVLTIGITAADLLKNKKYAEHLESWHERYAIVHAFLCGIVLLGRYPGSLAVEELNNEGPNGHMVIARLPDWDSVAAAGSNARIDGPQEQSGILEIRYVEIWDPCGPTITDPDISALVLSEETRGGGEFVNTERAGRNMSRLDVFEVGVVDALEEEDDGDQSTRKAATATAAAFESKLSSTEIRKAKAEATARARQSKV